MEVRFKNFRCFKDTGFLQLKKITLLVGENSSGKTSFLAGLQHLSGMLSAEDADLNTPPFEMGSFQDIRHKSGVGKGVPTFGYECKFENSTYSWTFEETHGAPSLKAFKAQHSTEGKTYEIHFDKNKVTLRVGLSGQDVKLLKQFDVDVTADGQHGMYVLQLKTARRSHDLTSFLRPSVPRQFFIRHLLIEQIIHSASKNDDNNSSLLREPNMSKLHKLGVQLAGQLFPRHYPLFNKMPIAHAPLRTEPERVYSHSKSRQGSTDPSGTHLPMRLHQLSKEDKRWQNLSKILSDFGEKAGLFKKVETQSLNKHSTYPFSIIVETKQGRTSNIMDVGYGVSQILPLVVNLISIKGPALFLLQQPEVHLHPRAQAEFGSLIARLTTEEKEKEFVIETHSDFIIDRIKYEIEKKNLSKDDVGILFFEQLGTGTNTKIHQIDVGEDGLPVNPPPSYRRFFLEELDRVWP